MQARPSINAHDLRAGTRALVGLCVLEAALLLLAIGWQKSATLKLIPTPGKAGGTFLAGLVLAALCLIQLFRQYRRSSTAGRRAFALGLTANLVALALALVGAELLLRSVATETSEGLRVGSVILPRTWDESRLRNAAVIAAASGVRDNWLTYVVADPELGWTVGPDRSTPDGLYYSSAEGVRSAGRGVTFAKRRPPLRIALIGDSYTFSMDVPFEESWGDRLERLLGRDVQVLNFGVDGYGLDQAWLRYQRDVRGWRPDIVLFGLIQHDVQRTVAVYPFLSFGWDYPFAKPRFAVAGAGLRLLNVPLIPPRGILRRETVGSLPFIDYDLGYQEGDWRWRQGHPPLLMRLFGTAFRRWPPLTPAVTGATATAISVRILRNFLEQAERDHAKARAFYFPSAGAGDFGGSSSVRTARDVLQAGAPGYLDLTDCVVAVPPAARLVPGRTHYTGRTNDAVARCIAADLKGRGLVRETGAGGGT